MNPELQTELAAWLSKLRESADAAGNFVLEQAPLIVQETIAYGRAWHTAVVVLAVVFMVGIAVIQRHIWRQTKDSHDPFERVFPLAASSLAHILPIALLCEAGDGFIKVWFAPRLYVLEWLTGLLK